MKPSCSTELVNRFFIRVLRQTSRTESLPADAVQLDDRRAGAVPDDRNTRLSPMTSGCDGVDVGHGWSTGIPRARRRRPA